MRGKLFKWKALMRYFFRKIAERRTMGFFSNQTTTQKLLRLDETYFCTLQ